MEIFYEQFLHSSKTKTQVILSNIATFFLLASAAYVILFNIVVAGISILIFLVLWSYCRQKYVEYEYELTSNELEISKIMNQKKRKVIAKINLNNICEVAQFNSIKNSKEIKFVKCFIKNENNVDVLIVNNGNGKIGYKLTMDKKMKEYCKRINPKVFIGMV